ncbi:MAG: ABC transporter ATP-binding protein [Chitinivibrionales bacterium]|nr:ABC transporter ATP-binding protein [Chitinivibrionales bacterium]
MQKKITKSSRAIRFMLGYLKRHSASVSIGVGSLVIVDLLQLIIPKIVGSTLDTLSQQHFSTSFILHSCLLILASAIGMVLFRYLWRIMVLGTSRTIEATIRSDMFSHIQTLSFSYFNTTKTGDLMALLINDLNAIRMALGFGVIGLVDMLFLGSMSLVFMLSVNVRLTLFCIIPLPLIIIVMTSFGRVLQQRFTQVQESFSTISSHSQESFSGIRIIKSFLQEEAEAVAFAAKCDTYVDKNIRLVKIWGFFFPSVTLLASLAMTIFFVAGSYSVLQRSISIGDFVSFTFYLSTIIWPMMAFGFVFNVVQRGIASTNRILALMETKPEISDQGAVSTAPMSGALELRHVTFTYEGKTEPALKDITFSAPVGSSVGIMGRPGSGKSTLAALLLRLFVIEPGTIFIDGIDINSIALRLLRGSIGYVPQDSFLFSDTISENIAFGMHESGQNTGKIEGLAQLASIYKDIALFHNGFNTIVGERGITLSGGQKQRVSIARALYIDPKIVILDDAFSSVDAKTEAVILNNLKQELKKCTSIIIAHRVSTVQECDQILVLDEGAIVERGTHQQLLAAQGYYAKLAQLQMLTDTYE